MSQRTYMPEDHQIGHGGSLSFCDTANGTYVTVRGTQSCNVPEAELGEVENTTDDTADYYKDYIPGMYEPGTAPFTYVFQPNQFADIDALFQLASVQANRFVALGNANCPVKYWKHTLPDGSVYAFKGWVKKHGLPREQENLIVVDAEIRVVGKTTFTPPSGS